jgi:hypothetical protein
VKGIHRSVSALAIVAAALLVAVSGRSGDLHAQGQASAIVGEWTLNKGSSDTGADRAQGRGDTRGGGYRRGGGGGRGGGRGGFGGGFPGGGAVGSGANPQDAARRMDALREITDAPERLTITQTESMVIITAGDGRTTRLSLDGKKIKDDSTGMERKTKWEGGKLISEITGAGPKITETYSADSEHHELLVLVQIEPQGRDEAPRVFHRLYERPPE